MSAYESLTRRLLSYPGARPEPRKTCIGFYANRAFAYLSPGLRKGTVRLTLLLRRRLDDPRALVVEPAPGRFTTHFDLPDDADPDETLLPYIDEAYLTSGLRAPKRRE